MNRAAGVGHERFMFCHLAVPNYRALRHSAGVSQFIFGRTAQR
jgi:hypothetical protein